MSMQIAQIAAEAARNKKAQRIILLDLKGKSDLCDYQIVCSGESDKQTKAIADAIEAECKAKFNLRPASIEGRASGHWILLDYGATIIHVFMNQLRDYYAIESLWPGAATTMDETPTASTPQTSAH